MHPLLRIQTTIDATDADGERGLSLVELLVAMSIFSIVLVVVFGVINSFQRAQTSVLTRAQGTSEAMIVFNQVARDIRNAQVQTTLAATTTTVQTPIASFYTSGIATDQLEIATMNPDRTPVTVCMVVTSSSSGIPGTCTPSAPTTAPICPCTLSAYDVGSSNTLRYSVGDITTAGGAIFTVTNVPNTTLPITVQIAACLPLDANVWQRAKKGIDRGISRIGGNAADRHGE